MAESGGKVPRFAVEHFLKEHYQSPSLACAKPRVVRCRDVEVWEFAALKWVTYIEEIVMRYSCYWVTRAHISSCSAFEQSCATDYLIIGLSFSEPSTATRTRMCELESKEMLASLRQPSKKRPRSEDDEEASVRKALLASREADVETIKQGVKWINAFGKHGAKALDFREYGSSRVH